MNLVKSFLYSSPCFLYSTYPSFQGHLLEHSIACHLAIHGHAAHIRDYAYPVYVVGTPACIAWPIGMPIGPIGTALIGMGTACIGG